jgi:hypothetical protein
MELAHLKTPRRGFEDNIETGLREMGCEGGKMKLAEDRVQWRY